MVLMTIIANCFVLALEEHLPEGDKTPLAVKLVSLCRLVFFFICDFISLETCSIKLCPHCRRKMRLSQKSATVAENGETTATFADCRTFLRQSHFSATNCRTFLRHCGQALRRQCCTSRVGRSIVWPYHFRIGSGWTSKIKSYQRTSVFQHVLALHCSIIVWPI